MSFSNEAVTVVEGSSLSESVGSTSPGESVTVSITNIVVVVVSPSVSTSWVVSVTHTVVLSPSVAESVSSSLLVSITTSWSLESITVLVENVVSDWGQILMAVTDSPSVLHVVTVIGVGS